MLENNADALVELSITTLEALHEAIRSGTSFEERLPQSEMELTRAFGDFSRLFPQDVADALVNADLIDRQALLDLPQKEIGNLLVQRGIEQRSIQHALLIMDKLRERASSEQSIDQVTGIELLIKNLEHEQIEILKDNGIETFSDWALKRPNQSNNKDMERIDAYVRLSHWNLKSDIYENLIDKAGIHSLHQLAGMSKKELVSIAKSSGIDKADLFQAVLQARARTSANLKLLMVAKGAGPTSLEEDNRPEWLDDITIDWDDYSKKCVGCPGDVSVISCLAYLIYLVQLTGNSLTELKSITNLDFPNISGDSVNQIAEFPQIDCEQITVCEQMTRALHDYLDQLKNNTDNTGDYQAYSYLTYPAWKSAKMALHYPELGALWRDDVLTGETGSTSHGSFLKDAASTRDHLFAQLSEVEEALETARVYYINSDEQDFAVEVSPNEFDNADIFKLAHQGHYNDFKNGLEVVKQILLADQAISDAYEMMLVDEGGNSIFHLHQAVEHLDQMSELTFDSASNWRYLRSLNSKPYQAMIDLPPLQRQEVSHQLFDELMVEEKPLFTPRNQDIVIDGLSDNGQISLTSSWISSGAFRDNAGKLEKYSASSSSSFVKYARPAPPEDYSRFTNYQISADLTLNETLTDNQTIALCTHWETNRDTRLPKKGYLLTITQGTEFNDGGGFFEDGLGDALIDEFLLNEEDVSTTRQLLTLHAVMENSNGDREYQRLTDPAQIGFTSTGSGVGSSTNSDYWLLSADQTYPMKLGVVGVNISGELKISENRTITISATDNRYPSGTFGFYGSEQTQFIFDNIRFEIEGVEAGFPPFHARRRTNSRNLLNAQSYEDHRKLGIGMPTSDLSALELTIFAERRALKSLAGLKKVGSNKYLTLLFDENTPIINLDLLDDLLEHCLTAAFYMRYAVIPVKLAQAYTLQGNFAQAIDHLKLVYDDFTTNESRRKIYPYLTRILNIFRPVPGADEKLMRLRLGENYLKQSDLLFRQNTSSSKYEAKQLFERVLSLHNENNRCECDGRLGEVIETVIKNIIEFKDIVSDTNVRDFIDLINPGYQGTGAFDYTSIISRNLDAKMPEIEFHEALKVTQKDLVKSKQNFRRDLSSQTTFPKIQAQGLKLVEEAELRGISLKDRAVVESRSKQDSQYKQYLGFGNLSIPIVDYLDLGFCIPQNPHILGQARQACLMLDLIENCINILGYKDDFIPPQRFEFLFALANNFSEAAFNAERDVLNFRKLLEDNVEQFMQAENNVALSNANLSLEALNIEHALGEISLVEMQKNQTEFSRDHFDQLIANGLSGYEELALNAAKATTLFSGLAAAGGIISAASSAVGTGMSASGNPAGIALAAAGIAGTLLGGAQGLANFSSSVSNLASMQANFERREQEWHYNLALNEIGVDIANQTIQQAIKRLDIVQRQHEIAQMRLEFAKDTLNFLENKFLNREMLIWMLRLSREQYRLRLNYAIASSFMAERALAFEMLSPALKTIRFDYFEPERDGLLGATQLQTDLKTLQVTKLNNEKRKLQLSRTLSLASLTPGELQTFKSTGILPFSTLLSWFDKDFPGHYQRLIRKLSVSVLALVPPHQGIKAMLRNSGISRVVTGPPYSPSFMKQTVARSPESIALTSAVQATGLISLDFQNEFLLPFEGLGVETDWILEMPQASNPFDFNTIADIFVTIEYTALHSDVYAQDVRETLGDSDSNDTPFNFRIQYPDQWYHLKNNPLDSEGKRKMSLHFRPEFLPPNYLSTDTVSTRHVTVILSGEFADFSQTQWNEVQAAMEIEHDYIENDVPNTLQVVFKTKTIDQDNEFAFFSTRDSNDPAYELDSGISPVGEWKMAIKDALSANQSLGERITDVLLIVTTEGTVDWG